MNVGLNDLDSSIAEKIAARINVLFGALNKSDRSALKPEDMSARGVLLKRWKGKGWGLAGRTMIGSVLGMGSGVALGTLVGDPGVMAAFGFMGGYLGTLTGLVGSLLRRRKTARTSISAEELRAVAPDAALSAAEAAYVEVVCSLLEVGDNVSEETGHDILQAMGTVLERHRHIEAQLERLKKMVGNESVQALELEHVRLVERVAAAEDSQAREDLNQSLTMCAKRLQDVQALGPSIERLEAQKEVLHQTLLSIQASAVRLQAAPRAVTLPDTTEIRQAVEEVTVQTRAVEDAVNEVLVLQSRG
jgi:hypothetical protein